MKLLGSLTIAIMFSGMLVLGMWTMPALGQGGNPPASTKESGQTSGRGQTALEQRAQAGRETTLTGCLSSPNKEGVYQLSTPQYKNGVEVAPEGIDLKAHVGHEVKLTGMWASNGAAIGEREKAVAKANEKEERHFRATKVEHVASSCTATSETEKPR